MAKVLVTAPPDCSLCPRLVESRQAVVNGYGPWPSKVVVVAQNPGRREEEVGEPLIGWSGQRLAYLAGKAGLVQIPPDNALSRMSKVQATEVFEAALVNLRRENIVRCRPPRKLDGSGDDTPTKKEINNCRPFLLDLLWHPTVEYVVTLGGPALKWFKDDVALGSAHGIPMTWWHPHSGNPITIVPMYHPAAAYPGRRPRLAETMINDWTYLGHVLRGEGSQYWEWFQEVRQQDKSAGWD